MKMNPDWHIRTPDDDRDYDEEEDRRLEIADHEILKHKCEEEEIQETEIQQAVAVIEKEAVVKVNSVQEREVQIYYCKAIKTHREAIVQFFKANKENTYRAWKGVVAQEKSYTDRLNGAERKIKAAVLEFDREQERVRQAEGEAGGKAQNARKAGSRIGTGGNGGRAGDSNCASVAKNRGCINP